MKYMYMVPLLCGRQRFQGSAAIFVIEGLPSTSSKALLTLLNFLSLNKRAATQSATQPWRVRLNNRYLLQKQQDAALDNLFRIRMPNRNESEKTNPPDKETIVKHRVSSELNEKMG